MVRERPRPRERDETGVRTVNSAEVSPAHVIACPVCGPKVGGRDPNRCMAHHWCPEQRVRHADGGSKKRQHDRCQMSFGPSSDNRVHGRRHANGRHGGQLVGMCLMYENIGRYIEITMIPTPTPITTVSNGSSNDVRLFTVDSTSPS